MATAGGKGGRPVRMRRNWRIGFWLMDQCAQCAPSRRIDPLRRHNAKAKSCQSISILLLLLLLLLIRRSPFALSPDLRASPTPLATSSGALGRSGLHCFGLERSALESSAVQSKALETVFGRTAAH